ncbi:MAG: family 16 glycosylhydrolase [Bacteroidales bacterium]|nr:family 16 glycosylhydrolase [Bacteroidales bacterium]
MGNITFGNKYFIFSKFSSIPKTSKIEQDRANLAKEHEDFIAFENSQELKDFYVLEKYLSSKEHSNLMSSIETGKKGEQEKKNRYESQKKSKKFKDYFRFKESQKMKNYNDFVESKELKDYEELENLVTSNEFASNKKSLEEQKAVEDQKEKEYNGQKKSKSFKTYFKFKDSAKLKEFNSIVGSKELKEFEELEKFINSDEFKQKENAADPKEFKNTEEGRKQQEYKNLKKSRNIKFYYKFGESAKYKSYLEFEKSEGLKDFYKLQDYINSDEFKEKKIKAEKELNEINAKLKDYGQKKKSKQFKDFYKFQNSQKFKDFRTFEKSKELADYLELEKYLASDEHKELLISLEKKEKTENDKKKQYEEFKNSKKYKWYLELKDSDKFDELKKWEIAFEDNFDSDKLNKEKWMTRYFWGDKLINDAYALETDTAFPTDGKNIEISNNILKIVTRKEKTNGKVWKQPFGFIPHDFDYTTGLVSTAKHHRQKYGKIEAKIKVNYAKPVNYNFWMTSEKNLPHVDILKLKKKKSKIDMAHHTGNITDKKGPDTVKAEFSGLDVSQDYFIYTLEWQKNKLTWKINDVVVNEQTQGIPQEEMYLVFSSSITGKVDGSSLPASMEIDWVRCYKEV